MPHVDIAAVEAQITKAKEPLLPLTKQSGSMGAQARMSLTVDTAFSRQLAHEINRGTSTDEVSDALAAVCANMICSLVESVHGDDTEKRTLVADINRQMFKTSRFLMQRFNGETEEVFTTSVPVESGGNA